MSDTLVILSTWNRTDLTGLTLDSLQRNLAAAGPVIILDDQSTEYGPDWFAPWGWEVRTAPVKLGVGGMARWRYETFLESGADYGLMLDNDVALSRGFDAVLRSAYDNFAPPASERVTVATGYRSVTQKVLKSYGYWEAVDTLGGVCHFVNRASAYTLMRRMRPEDWCHVWDGRISAYTNLILAPQHSLIQHRGIYGTGLNGRSSDVAFNFVGEGW